MAKLSSINKNKNRGKLIKKHAAKRAALKAIIMNRETTFEDRMQAQMALAKMPRNGAKDRVNSRCELSGRPRAVYRKFKLSRIAMRDLASRGLLPGVVKSSW